ncbi:hypothetical protein KKA95_05385 [Patescibacteria group bacterium]|nr:hypothetical protein [Patescibacteria group bacterium]
MLKKIALIIVLTFTFLLGGVTVFSATNSHFIPTTYAQDPDTSGDIDSSTFMFDLSSITHEDITGSSKQSWIRQGINYIFERIIGLMAAVIGGLAVLVMSYGGLLILTSAGGENQYQKGVNYVKYSLIGLAFVLGAYLLVTAVQILIKSIYA